MTESPMQLEHLAALLSEIHLQVLAGDYRVAARNMARLRARIDLLSNMHIIYRSPRRPHDTRTYTRALAKKRPWQERSKLIG